MSLSRVVLSVVVLLFANACVSEQTIVDEQNFVNNYFTKNDKPKRQSFRHQDLITSYIEYGDKQQPIIVFVHGTPGDLGGFIRYVTNKSLQSQAHLVSIDRPGWGDSQFDDGHFEASLEVQSHLLGPFLNQLHNNNSGRGLILVGHSLGGSLVPRIAMDYPHLIKAMIVISGSIAPMLGEPRWYNRFAAVPPFGWIVSKVMGKDMIKANYEIMPLKRELTKMLPLWPTLTMPVVVIQGTEDTLVHPGNAEFAKLVMPSADLKVIEVEGGDHFILWNQPNIVLQAITEVLEKI